MKWWRQKQLTKRRAKRKKQTQETEGCKGAPCCHIGEEDAGKPNPS